MVYSNKTEMYVPSTISYYRSIWIRLGPTMINTYYTQQHDQDAHCAVKKTLYVHMDDIHQKHQRQQRVKTCM